MRVHYDRPLRIDNDVCFKGRDWSFFEESEGVTANFVLGFFHESNLWEVFETIDLTGDFDRTGDRFSDVCLLTVCKEGIGVGGNTCADCSDVTDCEEVIVIDGDGLSSFTISITFTTDFDSITVYGPIFSHLLILFRYSTKFDNA